MLRTRGNYKNNQNHKVLEGIKWEENKKNATKTVMALNCRRGEQWLNCE